MRLVLLTAAALALAAPLAPFANAAADAPDLTARLLVERDHGDRNLTRFFLLAENVGDAATGPFQVRLDLDGEVLFDARVAGLPAGGHAVAAVTRPRGEEGLASFVVDAPGEVAEADESNNAATFSLLYHDVALAIRVEAVEGKILAQRVVVTACNVEGAASNGASVLVYLSATATAFQTLGSRPIPPLDPGACVEVSLPLKSRALGSYKVYGGLWDEWDENPANDLAVADAHVLADPGVGVLVPVAGPDV